MTDDIEEAKRKIKEDQETRKKEENHDGAISVRQAKRKHVGIWHVLGKIVTVSEMYVIEVDLGTQVIHKDAKSIQLEDIEKLDENERLDVVLYDDDITNVIPGEIVEILGNVELQDVVKAKKQTKTKIKRVIVNAMSIKYVNRNELVITHRDVIAFKKFAFDCQVDNCGWRLIKRLVAMFAPNVIGHDDVKLGLLRSIVGGDDHGQRGGGRVNTFMVGDPGTAKSTLGQEAAKIKPNSRHVSAPHASSKTITAIADKENEHVALRLGAIPLARNAICAIDEATAFQSEEQARLLDVLEEGILDVDKHGRHWTVPAPTTIIATANPIQSRWANPEVISNDEISMIKTLLDRFQQTYAFRDNMTSEQIDNFVSQMSAISKRKPHNYNFLRKYLIYASSIEVRTITVEARNMLNEFWKEAKRKGKLSMRMYGGLFSIAEAQAKLYLKNTIDEGIAKQTMESVQLMMVQYGETIKATTSPKVVTYNKFLEILQNNRIGVAVRSLCEIACKENPQIAAYLGRDWSMDGNSRIKVIVGMLRNHSQIKEVKSKPVVLQWNSTAVSGISGTTASDLISEELVSYDNRNENDADMPDVPDSNQELALKPRIIETCGRCGEELEAFYMKNHRCEGTD